MILEKEKVFFYHLPKTGGTAIDKFIAEYFGYSPYNINTFHWGFIQKNLPQNGSMAWTIQNVVHLPYVAQLKLAKAGKIVVDNSWKIFTVVRNPYYRLSSEMVWQSYLTRPDNYYTVRTHKERQFLFNESQNYFFNNDFQNNDWFNHRKSQSSLLNGTEEHPKCKIYKYENDLSFILIEEFNFDKNFKLKRENDEAIKLNVPKLKYETLWTRNFIENCNKWYEKDFERFDYQMLNPMDYPQF